MILLFVTCVIEGFKNVDIVVNVDVVRQSTVVYDSNNDACVHGMTLSCSHRAW